MPFKDHFSGHSVLYRDARPLPPTTFHEWLAGQVPDHDLAWDAGCGNGQATVSLARHFRQVIGTDPSADQIEHALSHENVAYRVEPAEHSSLADTQVSLVSVSQALHWFDLDAFQAEVTRVLKPGGVLAVSAYGNCSVERNIDAIERHLYHEVVGPYWPPERALVDSGYRDLAFPFEPVDTPSFEMSASWNLPQFMAYLRSWSATQRYIKARGSDPVAAAQEELAIAWGEPSRERVVRWLFFASVRRNGGDSGNT